MAVDSVMFWSLRIGLIDFMTTGKSLLDYKNLVFSNKSEKMIK